MNSRLLFNASAIVEVVVGVALLAAPGSVIGLLLGDGLRQTGAAVSQMLGIGLLSVGISAWETVEQIGRSAPRIGICTYNLGAAVLLSLLGTLGGLNGILLWPAAVLHASFGAAMLWMILARSVAGPHSLSESD
jgi:hypothetical protein